MAMHMTRLQFHLTRRQRGFALITSYMILVLLMAMEGTFLMRSLLEKRVATLRQESLGALYMAEGGIEQALQWLATQSANPPAAAVDLMGGSASIYPVPSAYTNLGAVIVTVEPDPACNVPNAYKITASSSVGYSTRTVTVGAAIQSFATYAYFTNNAADIDTNTARPWFRSDQTIKGPIHSNGYLRVMGTPVFTDAVTTSMDSIIYAGGTRNDGISPQSQQQSDPTYAQTPLVGVTPKPFPQAPGAALRTIAEPDGYVFKNAAYNFLSTGEVEVTGQQLTGYTIDGGGSLVPQYQSLTAQRLPLPESGVIFDEGSAFVRGQLEGQVTVGATDISITNHVRYNDGDPVAQPAGNDILGLVADRNVIISSSAPVDLEVHANILALESFRTGPDDTALNALPAKGTATIYGSVAVNEGRPLGVTDPNDPNGSVVKGYLGQYNYDPRVKTTLQPPGFPKEESLRILYWTSDKQQI